MFLQPNLAVLQLEELKGTGGRILKTSLSHEDESKLQADLSAARS